MARRTKKRPLTMLEKYGTNTLPEYFGDFESMLHKKLFNYSTDDKYFAGLREGVDEGTKIGEKLGYEKGASVVLKNLVTEGKNQYFVPESGKIVKFNNATELIEDIDARAKIAKHVQEKESTRLKELEQKYMNPVRTEVEVFEKEYNENSNKLTQVNDNMLKLENEIHQFDKERENEIFDLELIPKTEASAWGVDKEEEDFNIKIKNIETSIKNDTDRVNSYPKGIKGFDEEIEIKNINITQNNKAQKDAEAEKELVEEEALKLVVLRERDPQSTFVEKNGQKLYKNIKYDAEINEKRNKISQYHKEINALKKNIADDKADVEKLKDDKSNYELAQKMIKNNNEAKIKISNERNNYLKKKPVTRYKTEAEYKQVVAQKRNAYDKEIQEKTHRKNLLNEEMKELNKKVNSYVREHKISETYDKKLRSAWDKATDLNYLHGKRVDPNDKTTRIVEADVNNLLNSIEEYKYNEELYNALKDYKSLIESRKSLNEIVPLSERVKRNYPQTTEEVLAEFRKLRPSKATVVMTDTFNTFNVKNIQKSKTDNKPVGYNSVDVRSNPEPYSKWEEYVRRPGQLDEYESRVDYVEAKIRDTYDKNVPQGLQKYLPEYSKQLQKIDKPKKKVSADISSISSEEEINVPTKKESSRK